MPPPGPPAALRQRLAPVGLVALVLLSTAGRAYAARQVVGPWIAPDEMVYALLGLSLWHGHGLAILGGPTPFYSLLVPVLAGLPLALGGLAGGYGPLQVVQAAVLSLTAVPVYLWGRSLVPARWALLAAALAVAVPDLAYSGLVVSEVLFVPLVTLAAWATAAVLVRPSLARQALLAAAVLAACATRLQALALVPALLLAVLVHARLARSTATARRLWPAFAAFGAAACAWLAWRLAAGGALLGGYAGVNNASYAPLQAAEYVAYHAGSLLVLTGVLPVCALLLLLVEGARGRLRPAEAALVATVAALSATLVVEVGVFASRHVGHLAERDLLGLAPLLFLALALWLARGAPRPRAATAAVCLLAVGAVVALPAARLVTDAAAPDGLSLVPLIRLRDATSPGVVQLVLALAAVAAALLFALVPRRAACVPALLLLAGLCASSVLVSGYVAARSREQRAVFLGDDPGWVDRAASGPVAYVYDGDPAWNGVWQTVFWNRRIDRVLDLPGQTVTGAIPQTTTAIAPDGTLVVPPGGRRRPPPAFAVASTSLQLAGTPVAAVLQRGLGQAGLRLWRLGGPIRLVGRTIGVAANGDIAPHGNARVIGYGCRRGGTFVLTLLIKGPGTVDLLRNGLPWRALHFPAPAPGAAWRGRLPAAGALADGTCTLDVEPTGLVGSTVTLFEPGS